MFNIFPSSHFTRPITAWQRTGSMGWNIVNIYKNRNLLKSILKIYILTNGKTF